MKKYRFAAIFLALFLSLALTAPAAALTAENGHDHAQSHSGFPLVSNEGDEDAPLATAAIVVDGDTGEVLFEYNAHAKRYPASVTKIMTSLVVLEAIDNGELSLDTEITASGEAVQLPAGSSTAGIMAGEILTVEQLLYCDLVPSANEACNILAEAVTGLTGDAAISTFTARMNSKAAELGMTGSHFTNPHGLHDADHYTTAYDIYLMARAAMEYEIFRHIVSTTTYTLPATNLSGARTLHTTNSLLDNWYTFDYKYSKAIGIKTGSTDEAGRCLASAAVDDQGRTFYCVVLGCEWPRSENGGYDRHSFSETIRLLEWAFDNFHQVTLLDENTEDLIREIPVTMSDEADYVLALPVGSITATMPADFDPSKAELIVDLPTELEAPVTAGDVLGTVTFRYEEVEYGALELVAADSVARSEFQYNLQQAQFYWSQWWVKAAVFGGIGLILLLILWLGVIRPRRKKRYAYSGRRSGGGRRSYRGRR